MAQGDINFFFFFNWNLKFVLFQILGVCLLPAKMQEFMIAMKPNLINVKFTLIASESDKIDPELIRMCMSFLAGKEIHYLILDKQNVLQQSEM